MIQEICHGDCLELMKDIPDKSVDLILTDPPYEIKNMEPFFQHFSRILKDDGSMYIFGDKNMICEHWFSQLKENKKDLLVWYYKNSPKPKGRWRMSMQNIIYSFRENSIFNEDEARVEYQESTKKLNGRIRPSSGRMKKCSAYDTSKGALPRDVIECPALLGHLAKERLGHRDQKPINLIEKLIRTSSNEGFLIFDPFSGSGTTCRAAKNLNRQFIGIEKEEEYYKICLERLK